jgi:hypothetical protein
VSDVHARPAPQAEPCGARFMIEKGTGRV